MKIPNSKRRKALFVIDVQPHFVTDRGQIIVDNIVELLNNVEYDLYVDAVFYGDEDSMWYKQQGKTFPKGDTFYTVQEIRNLLKEKNPVHVEKDKKSIFKGNMNLLSILRKSNIEEIHLVGVDTNDCVLGSAVDSFDNQYYTYVIEECCWNAEDRADLHEKALDILRYDHLTNNSVEEKIDFINI